MHKWCHFIWEIKYPSLPYVSDQALSEAKASLEQIREEMQAWQAQHEATHKRLKTEQTANSALKVSTCTGLDGTGIDGEQMILQEGGGDTVSQCYASCEVGRL